MLAQKLWWLVFANFIAVVIPYKHDRKMLGPADFIFKSLKDCDNVDSIVIFGITQKKFNRTTNVLDVTIASPDYEIGDNLVVELKGSLKRDGGFKPGAYYFKETVCKLLEMIVGDIVDDLLTAAEIEGCPIPPGSYQALDFYFDNTKFTIPQLFGEYKMEITVFKDDVPQSCFLAYYDLVAKKDEEE